MKDLTKLSTEELNKLLNKLFQADSDEERAVLLEASVDEVAQLDIGGLAVGEAEEIEQ